MTNAKAYLSYFKIRLATGLQYRAAALAGAGTQFFWGFLLISIYRAFYSSTAAQQDITYEQLVCYFWLQQAFLALLVLWFRDGELFGLITNGNIAYEMARPLNIYLYWYIKLIAQRITSAALRCGPILIVAVFLPRPYRLLPPPGAAQLGLFVAALLLGMLLVTTISMLIYITTFVTLSPIGSFYIFTIISDFLGGFVIPIPLMPKALQNVVYWLPFRYVIDFPLRVYSGNIPVGEALVGLCFQIVWVAIIAAAGSYAMSRALGRVVVQGG